MVIHVIMVALVIVMTPLIFGLLCTAHSISVAAVIHRNHRDHVMGAVEILHQHAVADHHHPMDVVEIFHEHGGGAQPLGVAGVVHHHDLMIITGDDSPAPHVDEPYWF